ncbi:HPF/RaiA family ribosome-associated protein [Hyalangium rubrum]|uniref:HPF/RaiA family ribosome-associated protein n=1 Tax=Hyalangium rubrum TaxID=3103134 RepID=A0ABU5GXZ4_9BACT|nr:HPF/RaiA family ribosome-associated protein [Hyalangium sp. s54d21]MDY7226071.1 HPF/RaiA family ribosome-associated protein [Hyalangium sp. s54d21]
MNRPLQITYRGMESSEAMSEHIRDQAEKLEQLFDRIVGCHVVVEQPHKHQRQGNHFHVRLDLHVPGKDIVVGKDHAERRSHEDPYQAVNEAFDAARMQLQHHADAQREHR